MDTADHGLPQARPRVYIIGLRTGKLRQRETSGSSAPTPGALVGHALLAAITALALLEHWLMVLPLPDAKLWRWMLPAPKQDKGPEGHHGF